MYMRRNHGDRYAYSEAVLFGPSQHNQPIESLWGRFRIQCEQFWIEEFGELKETGDWRYGVLVDKWCLLYVFFPFIKEDIDCFRSEYNSHRIRYQRNAVRPSGVPEDMYNFPGNYGGVDKSFNADGVDIRNVTRLYNLSGSLPDYIPPPMRLIANRWVRSQGIVINRRNAKDVYLRLRRYVNNNI
ncbi:uncharacterized protein [Amphiura filiformis]|uniref:uncharacterized protein n=1 Tax=Amphiura filiformis TaxID=82378 RepID=UPI003B20C157